jgi:hypothetical protein
MPLFDSRGLWPAVVVVQLLAVIALVFAAVGWFERSSDTAFAEFISANELSVPEVDHSEKSSPPEKNQNGRTGCPVGKKDLPSQLIPFR